MRVVVAIDIDSNWQRKVVDVDFVRALVVERSFAVSRAVVDLKSKFLLVCCSISTKNSIVVVVHVVAAVVAVAVEVAALDFDNSTSYRYYKRKIVASYPIHLC